MIPLRRHALRTMIAALAALGCAGCAGTAQKVAFDPPAQVRPAPNQTYLELGNRLLGENEPALAMQAFLTSVSVEGMSPQALTGAGVAARQQGLLYTAKRYLEQARDMAPDSAIAQNNLGVVLFLLRDYAGAHTAFRAALKLADEQHNAAIKRNLERAEAALDKLDQQGQVEPVATQQVVRLGSDLYRITDNPAASKATPPTEAETN
jgi:tetratricopeptide (TPR) repeat protein